MHITDKTQFLGVSLGQYLPVFKHNLNVSDRHQMKTLWVNTEENTSSLNFIVELKNGMECAGTIIESGTIDAVYIVAILEKGTFEL